MVGMACRFPGQANDPASFWRLLEEGRHAVTEVPRDRWDVDRFYDPDPDAPGKVSTRWGGFLEGIDQFDPALFGISQAEAEAMEPQQRILLELAWEALESSGYPPLGLSDTRTGVFAGIFQSAYGELLARRAEPTLLDQYSAHGIAHCTAVGRLSFLLGLQGPSIPVNTACSSSTVAVHLACQSLLSGESDLALAGGVNVMLSLDWLISLCRMRLMSPDGKCRSFDALANGMVESEGGGLLVLKRLADAQAAGDRILALIRGTAVNHSGRSASLTAPNGLAQQTVVRRALAAAGVSPSEVGHLEAQGTATPLGDSIEISAMGAVLGEGRAPGDKVWLTSVKTNIGHTESASGVASLIKVILSLQHGAIPPHLHFQQINPNLSPDQLPFAVPTRLQPWPRSDRPRVASVNSFGMSGVNAHVVLEEAPAEPPRTARARPRHLFCLSAQTDAGLRDLAQRYRAHLAGAGAAPGEPWLGDLAFTATAGRTHLPQRLAVTAGSRAELDARLESYLQGGLASARATAPERRKLAFLFPGEGFPSPRAVQSLSDAEPVFRGALDRCAQAVDGSLQRPLLDALLARGAPGGDPPQAPPSALMLYAFECALYDLWRSWGVEPHAVLGSGPGDLVAGYAAGMISLEEGARLLVAGPASADPGTAAAERIPYFSASTGARVSPREAHALWRQRSASGRFEEGLLALLQTGAAVLLEVGPGTSLAAKARLAVPADRLAVVASLGAGADVHEALLSAAGALYARGVPLDFRAMDRPFQHRPAPAPTYPFQRQRYWLSPGAPKASATQAERAGEERPLLGTAIHTPRGEVHLEGTLAGERLRAHQEHRMGGKSSLSMAAAFDTILSTAMGAVGGGPWELHQVRLGPPIPLDRDVKLQLSLGPESGGARSAELHAYAADGTQPVRWLEVASGELRRAQPPAQASFADGAGATLERAELYRLLKEGGFDHGPSFQLLERLRIRVSGGAVAEVGAAPAASWSLSLPAANACLEALAALQCSLLATGAGAVQRYFPTGVERVFLQPGASGPLRCEVSFRGDAGGVKAVGDIRAVDAQGCVVLEVRGLALRQSSPADAKPLGPTAASALLERLRALLPRERIAALQSEVRQLLAGWLNLPELGAVSASRPLTDVGVDSLRAMELRNALGRLFCRTFPTTLLFDSPTVEKLTWTLGQDVPELRDLLSEGRAAPADKKVSGGPPVDSPAGLLERLSQLSDEEAAALAASLEAGVDR
ncbi:MAG TPA: beta-ketoacyl synthase N-terminal-like domain-containing protein [Myxococcaceae bacterium]|nr:beta-ketoacyl synthase N-terminal-like domain-containing protein [Myxococcaceae bacterium]